MKKQLRAAEGVFIITILITFLVCYGLCAAEETLPSAEEIVAKNIEAVGSKEAINKIYNKKTVTIRKIPQMNIGVKHTDYSERPNKYYQSVGKARFGANGKISWSINPDGVARLFEGYELSMRLLGAKFRVLNQPYMPYKSMKTEGTERINGKECYKVVKTGEKGY